MQSKLINTLAALFFLLAGAAWADDAGGAAEGHPLLCPKDIINPASDVNWNNALPITIGGVNTQHIAGKAPRQPSDFKIKAVCDTCKLLPPIGLGITYWQPSYVAEVQNKAGCFPTLLGAEVSVPNIAAPVTDSNGPSEANDVGSPRQMHVHLIKYPLFALMDFFNALACNDSSSAIAIAGFTEIEPFWKDDMWSSIIMPESLLYANPISILACSADAVASNVNFPIDRMNWCVGSQGILYPTSGRTNGDNSLSYAEENVLIMAKYMQVQARQFRLPVTTGSEAKCGPTFTPNLKRSQYRIDPLKPVASKKSGIKFGQAGSTWGLTPPLHPGKRYDNAFLLWQGYQCCATP